MAIPLSIVVSFRSKTSYLGKHHQVKGLEKELFSISLDIQNEDTQYSTIQLSEEPNV